MVFFNPKPECAVISEAVDICHDEVRRRFMKANRDIPVGEIVCFEKGIVVNIDKNCCTLCLTPILKKGVCVNCQDVYEERIKVYEEATEDVIDNFGLLKLAVRIVLTHDVDNMMKTIEEYKGELSSELDPSSFRAIMELIPGEPMDIKMLNEILTKIYVNLKKNHPDWKLFDNKHFLKLMKTLFLRLPKNAHTIFSFEKTLRGEEIPCGSGIFPLSSIFNHSCKPNVYSYFIGNTFVFVSMGVRKGEELLDNYGASVAYMPLNVRKDFLTFKCICPCCTTVDHDVESLVSPNDALKDVETMTVYFQKRASRVLPRGHIEWAILQNHLLKNQILSPIEKIQLMRDELENMRYRKMILHPDQTMLYLRLACVLGTNRVADLEETLVLAAIRIHLFTPYHPFKEITSQLLGSLKSGKDLERNFQNFKNVISKHSLGINL